MEGTSPTLSKNAVKQFILRMDFGILDQDSVAKIIEQIAPFFDRIEKRSVQGIKFQVDPQKADVQRNDTQNIICVSDLNGTLTFEELAGAIVFESTKYKNKDTYLGALSELVEAFIKIEFNKDCNRIGMRFINEFPCEKKENIGRIFDKRISSVIRSLISREGVSRAIAMEEGNFSDFKSRAQFGIVNKYYPEPIRVYDLLLDIDYYIDSSMPYTQFKDAVRKLNHEAFHFFKSCMNPTYFERLK